MIYLDSGYYALLSASVVAEAVAEAISGMGNCSRGAYKEALTGARVIFETRVLYQKCSMEMVREQVVFTIILPKLKYCH